MYWRRIVALFKLCNTPVTIYSPFPLFAISLFLVSSKELSIYEIPLLIAGIILSWLLAFASNLWNHCNDLKEDIAAGKETILTMDRSMPGKAMIISALLYISSLFFAYYLSIEYERPIYIFALIWIAVTWWYSDNLILKKLIGFRLKEHYMGELIAYSLAMPAYTISVWLVYSDLNSKGIIITIAVFLFSISALLLKDLKDISGDTEAGLRTFGVAFLPSDLIRYSSYLMLLFFMVLLNPFTMDSYGIMIIIVPFIYYLKNTFIHLYKKGWSLDSGDFHAINSIGRSIYSSFICIGLSGLL